MRTLHIDSGREMRGGQWQALYLVRSLPGAVLLAPAESPLLARAREAGVATEALSLRAIRRRAREADLVHAHDARAHSLAALFAGRPLVVSRRVAFPVKNGPASRWKYAVPSRFIAISQAVADRLREAGIGDSRIRVVCDGVPLLPESSLDGPVIAPATGDPMKGSALLKGLDVRFSSDLEKDLRTARALVYLTYEEGLGSAVLLAMSAGVPVVASRVGGLAEVVRHGRTGLLVENDPARIEEAMRSLRPEWGREGRRVVEERFTVEAMVRGTIEVYREVLG